MIRHLAFVLFLSSTLLYAKQKKPNIIIFYTDDQGYGDCSALNKNSKFQTPFMDEIAKKGIIYTDGHSSNTVCSPSRYGLLTGRHSWRTYLKKGVIGSAGKPMIDDDRTTLAGLLKRNGYQTAMVGKWHLGMDFDKTGETILNGPLQKGFDYYFGIPASMNYGYCAWYEMNKTNTPPILYTKKKPNKMAISDYRVMPPYSETKAGYNMKVASDFLDMDVLEKFTNKANAYIDRVHADDKPFFLYMPLTSPHKPVVPQERFRGKSQAGAYGDFMIETDYWIGQVMNKLKEHGIYDDTMLILSSDNGPETTWKERIKLYSHVSSEKYKGGKRNIYEGGHRVPFLVSWPNGIDGGQTYHQPVSQIDIFATLAEVLGDTLGENEAEDSFSFASSFNGKQGTRGPMIHQSSSGGYSIRLNQWKLILGIGESATPSKDGKMELYNLDKDIKEKQNLFDTHPEKVKELKSLAKKIISSGRTRNEASTSNDRDISLWWF